MGRKTMTKRVITNKPTTLSDCLHTKVKVHFDLVETRDIVDGVPDLEFGYGNLRFGAEAKPGHASGAHSRVPAVLAGGKIQTTILLSGPHAFTVMGVVKEIRIYKANPAA
ncbi:MAG: hypothetical protein WBQ94_11935 [Terracidiphilus sp.]